MSDLVKEFKEISRRDDCFKHMVPSDVRMMLAEIERLRESIRKRDDYIARHLGKEHVMSIRLHDAAKEVLDGQA